MTTILTVEESMSFPETVRNNQCQPPKIKVLERRHAYELEMAQTIQTSLFPTDKKLAELEKLGFKVFVFHRSSHEINGNMVCLQHFVGGHFMLNVFDSQSHGLVTSQTTMLISAFLNSLCSCELMSGAIFNRLNQNLRHFTGFLPPVTALNFCYSPKSGLSFSRAGFPYPIFYRKKTNSFEELKEGGFPLGFVDWNYKTMPLKMASGDKVMVISNGYFEQEMAANEVLWYQVLAQYMPLPSAECRHHLRKDFFARALSDDTTLLLLEKI